MGAPNAFPLGTDPAQPLDLQGAVAAWVKNQPKDIYRRVETPAGHTWALVTGREDSLELQLGNSRTVEGRAVLFLPDFRVLIRDGVLRVVAIDIEGLVSWQVDQQPLHPFTEPPVGPPKIVETVRAVLTPILEGMILLP